jgi:hypothetical protein
MLLTILGSVINIIGGTLDIHGHLRRMRIFSLVIKYICIQIMRTMAMILMLDLLIILWKFKWREVDVPECA